MQLGRIQVGSKLGLNFIVQIRSDSDRRIRHVDVGGSTIRRTPVTDASLSDDMKDP